MPRPLTWLLFGCALLLAAVSSGARADEAAGKILIRGEWARILPNARDQASVYFQIVNTADQPDRLIQVSADIAGETRIQHSHWKGLRYVLEDVSGIDIGARRSVKLAPGRYQINLSHLREAVNVGETLSVSLEFEHGGRVEIHPRISNFLLGNR